MTEKIDKLISDTEYIFKFSQLIAEAGELPLTPEGEKRFNEIQKELVDLKTIYNLEREVNAV